MRELIPFRINIVRVGSFNVHLVIIFLLVCTKSRQSFSWLLFTAQWKAWWLGTLRLALFWLLKLLSKVLKILVRTAFLYHSWAIFIALYRRQVCNILIHLSNFGEVFHPRINLRKQHIVLVDEEVNDCYVVEKEWTLAYFLSFFKFWIKLFLPVPISFIWFLLRG